MPFGEFKWKMRQTKHFVQTVLKTLVFKVTTIAALVYALQWTSRDWFSLRWGSLTNSIPLTYMGNCPIPDRTSIILARLFAIPRPWTVEAYLLLSVLQAIGWTLKLRHIVIYMCVCQWLPLMQIEVYSTVIGAVQTKLWTPNSPRSGQPRQIVLRQLS